MTAYHTATKKVKHTPQTMSIPGRESEMIKNAAGGYTFVLDVFPTFRRFLILGTTGGTYYVGQEKLTDDAIKMVRNVMAGESGVTAVRLLADISDQNLAPKVSPTLFALACAFASPLRAVRKEAVSIFKTVVRTQSHMMEFVSYVDGMRAWGRLLRETVADWYNSMPADKLAYQMLKYRTRNGWSTGDILRSAHPRPPDKSHGSLYAWAVGKDFEYVDCPEIINIHEMAMAATVLDTKDGIKGAAKLIVDYGLTREMIPNTWLDKAEVWDALLQKMPLTAMIRNLGKMSSVGLLKNMSAASKLVVSRLNNTEYLRKSRVHPMTVLLAMKQYASGHGLKGKLKWTPVATVTDALDRAFYASFGNVPATEKNIMLALDVSSSMNWGYCAGGLLTPAEGSVAMALVTANVEPNYMIFGFANQFKELNITSKMRLNDAMAYTRKISFGGTDCSMPFQYALKNRLPVDTFVVYTDNETWAGRTGHPSQWLQKFRNEMSINARSAVVGMTATQCSIADPKDPGMLDVVGFDASTPETISQFSAGKI